MVYAPVLSQCFNKPCLIFGCQLLSDAERREPMRDEDCFWDYAKARCGRPDRCEYRYLPSFASLEICTGLS